MAKNPNSMVMIPPHVKRGGKFTFKALKILMNTPLLEIWSELPFPHKTIEAFEKGNNHKGRDSHTIKFLEDDSTCLKHELNLPYWP